MESDNLLHTFSRSIRLLPNDIREIRIIRRFNINYVLNIPIFFRGQPKHKELLKILIGKSGNPINLTNPTPCP